MKRSTRQLIAINLVLFLVASASLSATVQDESWRKTAPPSGAVRAFNLPQSREVKLNNGLTLVLVEDHRSPVVTIQAAIPLTISSQASPATLTLEVALAEATADLLTEGAGARTSRELARKVESLGGRLSSAMNYDYTEVSASVISENAEAIIDLLGDVLLRPRFSLDEIALYKTNRIQSLAVQRQDPEFLVGERFNRVVYGPHSYGVSAPPESVRAINRARIMEFYKAHYSPESAIVTVVGDFDSARIESSIRATLGRWKPLQGGATHYLAGKLPDRRSRQIYLIDRPGSEQSAIRIGRLGVSHSHQDYFPLIVANAVMGAGTGSRLFLNIREQKGYTYDVYSSVSALKEAGTFYIASETRTEVTASAIKEIFSEIKRLRDEKVPDEELQNAKNYLSGLFSITLSTQGGIAERITQNHVFGLGADYIDRYRQRVQSVMADDVRRVVRNYLSSETLAIVVVGDRMKLEKQLSKIGTVEVFNTQGKRVR